MSRSCLKFRGGNDDRNGIYLYVTEVISNAISLVNPFHGAFAKKCSRESHEMAQNVLKIVHLMAMICISMRSAPSLEKVSSYGLLSRFIYIYIYISLLVEYKKLIWAGGFSIKLFSERLRPEVRSLTLKYKVVPLKSAS